ncbi:hypothetical protein CVT24_001324 [Panaeolus cyanescens]|uniref:Rhodanese domain-containing protein n=1 Tax=Panaeolus cyanescens TaxID=181874 RepID=A0A409WS68_9AGAR|nr:hypothetical protein CVT24_001324 [Panaeolus cyanescens]
MPNSSSSRSSNASGYGRTPYDSRGSASGMSHSQSVISHSQSQSQSHNQSQSQSRSQSQSQSYSQPHIHTHAQQYTRDSSSLRAGQYTPRSPSSSSALGSPNARYANTNTNTISFAVDPPHTKSTTHPNPHHNTSRSKYESHSHSRDRYDGHPRPASPPPPRTLDDIRDQVSQEVAIHVINKLRMHDGVKIGVRFVMTEGRDDDYLRLIGAHVQYRLSSMTGGASGTGTRYLIALATSPFTGGSSLNTLLICSSEEDLVQRCVLLSSSKFLGRIIGAAPADPTCWIATIRDLGLAEHDEIALWDVLEKSARAPIDPLLPPPGSQGIVSMINEARARLQRISAEQALDELRESQVGAPTFLVDIRSSEQRKREGAIHGSLIIDRNVLEWKFDPRAVGTRLSIADRYDLRIIVFDQEGNMSSLAAHSLQQIGLLNATDIIGGYEAWKMAGLPIDLDTLTTTFISQNNTTTRDVLGQNTTTTRDGVGSDQSTMRDALGENTTRNTNTNSDGVGVGGSDSVGDIASSGEDVLEVQVDVGGGQGRNVNVSVGFGVDVTDRSFFRDDGDFGGYV